jgi:Tfp pilus assembly PilM family ATPase
MVCNIAGLNLVAVEIEPLAMNRVLRKLYPEDVNAYLNIGGTRSFFSVFKNDVLVFYRSLAFGISAFYAALEMSFPNGAVRWEDIQFGQGSQYDYLTRDLIDDVTRSVEYYNLQKNKTEERIEKIWLCGAGARFKGLDASLASGSGWKSRLPTRCRSSSCLPTSVKKKH